MPATVIGLRHAEVENPRGVIYASLDGFALSSAGRAQASAAAAALSAAGLVCVYSSPLERAVATAQAVATAAGAELRVDERLSEWRHWDAYAGWTWEELRDRKPQVLEAYMSDPASIAEGESLDELADRMSAWLRDVGGAHPAGVVAGVSHLEPLRALLLRLLGRSFGALAQVRIGHADAVALAPVASAEALGAEALLARL